MTTQAADRVRSIRRPASADSSTGVGLAARFRAARAQRRQRRALLRAVRAFTG